MSIRSKKKSLIQKLDNINFWKCKNVKMGTALCVSLSSYNDWNWKMYKELKSRINRMGKYKMQFDKNAKGIPCFVLTSYNIGRTDQTEMFVKLTELFSEKYVIKAIESKNVFHDVNLQILIIWFLQMSRLRLTLLQKKIILLYMYIYYSEANYLFTKIMKKKDDIKVVAVFDDIFPIDNMVVQLCKSKDLKTTTFHHAIINGSYKYIEYKYSVSDFFLAWGNYTRDIAVRYGMDINKIKILGPISKIGEVKWALKSMNEKVFGILTRNPARSKYINENINMIHMANAFAQKYGYKYILRFHPADSYARGYLEYVDKNVYIEGNKKDTLVEFLQKVEFCICANTSAYADSIYYGKVCYRYISKQEEKIDVCKGINFGKVSNLEQLELKYNEYRTDRNLDKRMERVSAYIYEKNVENNYKEFFNKLIGN